MATLSITIPDEQVPRIAAAAREGLVRQFAYEQPDVDALTDADAVRTWTKKTWQMDVSRYEGRIAGSDQQQQSFDELEPVPEP